MTERSTLLFVSPAMPAATGNGLAMRAGQFLEAYARDFAVDLIVVPIADPFADPGAPFANAHADSIAVIATGAPIRAPRQIYDILHVFRLSTTPFAAALLERGRTTILDADESDRAAAESMARLHGANGDPAAAEAATADALRHRSRAAKELNRYDRVLCSSAVEAERLMADGLAAAPAVIPNSYPAPDGAPGGNPAPAFDFLLVGSFGYPPNADAAIFFVEDVWPRIRSQCGPDVSLGLVGSLPPEPVKALRARPGIHVLGFVPELDSLYRRAKVAVVPLRAGGGTRIKIIEAWAHGVPVVSTAVGAEGLDARPDKDLLIADDPDRLADACAKLWHEPELRARLAETAAARFRDRYRRDRVIADIRRLASDILARSP